jgi:hypothetical protein
VNDSGSTTMYVVSAPTITGCSGPQILAGCLVGKVCFHRGKPSLAITLRQNERVATIWGGILPLVMAQSRLSSVAMGPSSAPRNRISSAQGWQPPCVPLCASLLRVRSTSHTDQIRNRVLRLGTVGRFPAGASCMS